MTTLLELANRFRTFTFDKPEPETQTVWYSDESSAGNRYRRWKRVTAKRTPSDDDNVIDMDRLYKESSGKPCDWGYLFSQIHHGLINGPETLAAVEECLSKLCFSVVSGRAHISTACLIKVRPFTNKGFNFVRKTL